MSIDSNKSGIAKVEPIASLQAVGFLFSLVNNRLLMKGVATDEAVNRLLLQLR